MMAKKWILAQTLSSVLQSYMFIIMKIKPGYLS